jgi:hypothetical protein
VDQNGIQTRFPRAVVATWAPVAAIHGTGSVLVGPHGRGAQAIVPPGVLARTAAGAGDEYSDAGWRHAIWEFREGTPPNLEAQRPARVLTPQLADLVQLIRDDAPEHEPWIRAQARERLQALHALIDHAAVDAEQLTRWLCELDDLILDAAGLFGREWTREHMVP